MINGLNEEPFRMDFACIVLCRDGKAVLSSLYHDILFGFFFCIFIALSAVDVHSVLLLL